MPDVNYPIGSVEYIKGTVVLTGLDDNGDPIILDAQPVEISIDGKATWLPATWLGDPGTTRSLRSTSVYTFATKIQARSVYARVTDSPEIPIIRLGGKLSAS